ncbi:hypothetical protein B0H11DRAFT_1929647 [Mycena galericulata]|nr:hypothetical protein B0H11DRAFT_1929647 [Mycena galericulata]
MAPLSWTTPEEDRFLKAQVAPYLTAKTNKKLWQFWPQMHAGWFSKFPEEPRLGFPGLTEKGDAPTLSEEQSAQLKKALSTRKGQLVNWLRHHSKKTNDIGAVQRNASNSLATTLFSNKESNNRVHRPIELFQKVCTTRIDAALEEEGFYEVNEAQMSLDIEDLEEESTEERAARIKEARGERMSIRNRVVNTLFNQISPEERTKLDELIAEEKEAAAAKAKGENKSTDGERTPAEYLRAIDESAEVFAKVHKTIASQTGWHGFSVYGGPNPRFKGALSMKVVCFGETSAGNDFEAAHGSFDEGISKPFQAFLKRCFSSADRRARALVEEEDKTEAILPSLDGLFRMPSDEGASRPKPTRVKPKKKTKAKSSNQPAPSAPPAPITPAPPPNNPEASDSLLPTRPVEERASSAVSSVPDSEGFHFDTLTMPNDVDVLDVFNTPTDFNEFDFTADDAYTDDASGGWMDIDEPTTLVRPRPSFTPSTSTRTTNVMGFNFSAIDSQFHTPQVPSSRIRGLFDEFRNHVASSPIHGSAPFATSSNQAPATEEATQKVAPIARMALTAPSVALSSFACAAGVPTPTSSSLIARTASAPAAPRVAVPSPFASVVPRTTLPTPFASVVPHTAPSLFASVVPHTAPSLFASVVPRAALPSPFARPAAAVPTPPSSLLAVTAFAPVLPRPAASSPFTRAAVVVVPAATTSSLLATIDEECENAAAVPVPVHIRSRPMTKPPLVPKVKGVAKPKAAPKSSAAKSVPAREAAAAKAAKAAGKRPVGRPKKISDEVEGEASEVAAKRPVGRPRKSTATPMNDLTNDASASTGALAAPSSSSAAQPLVFSMPGNNTLNYNRRKDAEMAARQAAVRAENARVFNPDGETPLIIVPPPPPSSDTIGPRTRKPSQKALAMVPKQPTRAQQAAKRNAASENALLARAGSKRGAVDVAEGEGSAKRPTTAPKTVSKGKRWREKGGRRASAKAAGGGWAQGRVDKEIKGAGGRWRQGGRRAGARRAEGGRKAGGGRAQGARRAGARQAQGARRAGARRAEGGRKAQGAQRAGARRAEGRRKAGARKGRAQGAREGAGRKERGGSNKGGGNAIRRRKERRKGGAGGKVPARRRAYRALAVRRGGGAVPVQA